MFSLLPRDCHKALPCRIHTRHPSWHRLPPVPEGAGSGQWAGSISIHQKRITHNKNVYKTIGNAYISKHAYTWPYYEQNYRPESDPWLGDSKLLAVYANDLCGALALRLSQVSTILRMALTLASESSLPGDFTCVRVRHPMKFMTPEGSTISISRLCS